MNNYEEIKNQMEILDLKSAINANGKFTSNGSKQKSQGKLEDCFEMTENKKHNIPKPYTMQRN